MKKLFKELAEIAPDTFAVVQGEHEDDCDIQWEGVGIFDAYDLSAQTTLRSLMLSYMRAKWRKAFNDSASHIYGPVVSAFMVKKNYETCDKDIEIAFLAFWKSTVKKGS